jgi:hypothetical protein
MSFGNHNHNAVTVLVAIGDKNMTLEEIVSEEIDEECGYKVDKKD